MDRLLMGSPPVLPLDIGAAYWKSFECMALCGIRVDEIIPYLRSQFPAFKDEGWNGPYIDHLATQTLPGSEISVNLFRVTRQ